MYPVCYFYSLILTSKYKSCWPKWKNKQNFIKQIIYRLNVVSFYNVIRFRLTSVGVLQAWWWISAISKKAWIQSVKHTHLLWLIQFFLCINCWTVLHHRWPHFETTYSLKPEFMKITICNHDQHFNSNFLFLSKKGEKNMKQANVWRFKILI